MLGYQGIHSKNGSFYFYILALTTYSMKKSHIVHVVFCVFYCFYCLTSFRTACFSSELAPSSSAKAIRVSNPFIKLGSIGDFRRGSSWDKFTASSWWRVVDRSCMLWAMDSLTSPSCRWLTSRDCRPIPGCNQLLHNCHTLTTSTNDDKLISYLSLQGHQLFNSLFSLFYSGKYNDFVLWFCLIWNLFIPVTLLLFLLFIIPENRTAELNQRFTTICKKRQSENR